MPRAKSTVKRKSTAKVSKKAQWTILVYLAGDNDLSAAGRVDIAEMKEIGSNADRNVVVQYDRAGAEGTKRYYLRRGTVVARDVVQDLGETNSGDPQVLRDFLEWGVDAYPAQHYLVVIWNHGAGWDDSNIYKGDYFGGAAPPVVRKGVTLNRKGATRPAGTRTTGRAIPLAQARAGIQRGRRAIFASTVSRMIRTRAVAFDDQAQDFLDNIELKKVMAMVAAKIGRPIDVLGFDACLMSMLEIECQIADTAQFMVASQEEEPGDGWPYDRLLKALAKNPAMTPKELCRTAVEEYAASYRSQDGVTQSAVDLRAVDRVTAAVDALARALLAAIDEESARAKLAAVRAAVQSYTPPYDEYVDLVDLCDGLQHMMAQAKILEASAATKQAVKAMVVASEAKGSAVARSRGVSIYFPKKKVCALYQTLEFAKSNAWPRFIAAFTAKVAQGGWR